MGRIIGVSNAMWSRIGPRVKVQDAGNGTFLFKMPNRRSRDLALSRKIWHVGSAPMFISAWSPYHTTTKPTLTSIATWVSFRNLPHQAFSTDSLSRIATTVGTPMYPDRLTKTKEYVEVARIYIDVNLRVTPPRNIMITLPDGQNHLIDIAYDWLPPRCSNCSEIGHSQLHCPLSTPIIQPTTTEEASSKGISQPSPSNKEAESVQPSIKPQEIVGSPATSSPQNQDQVTPVNTTVQNQAASHRKATKNQKNQRKEKAEQVLGDFNQCLTLEERSNGFQQPGQQSGMNDLQDCLLEAKISDMPARGSSFTWCNNHLENPRSVKLDRALTNQAWKLVFPSSYAEFTAPGHSDHTPCIIHLPDNHREIVSRHWIATDIEASPQFQLCRSLKLLKKPLRHLNQDRFSQLSKRVKEAEVLLKRVQTNIFNAPTTDLLAEEKIQRQKYMLLVAAEERFYRQRSRIRWLRLGDKNTAYFHHIVVTRAAKNHIHFLINAQGSRLSKAEEIKEHAVQFYSDLMGRRDNDIRLPTLDWLHDLIPYRWTNDQGTLLDAIPTDEDIKNAFFSLPDNKAPGPDGYPKEFYTKSWQLVGGDVTRAIKDFFLTGKLLGQINATTLALIPKKQEATKLTEFRPISCCNTLYKVISSILARRIRAVAMEMVSRNQNAFVKGRLMIENILLASEIIREYNRASTRKSAMFKVDIRKAFDSLDWTIIIRLLQAINLPHKFISWISTCITTPKFSVAINGELTGYFKGRKGLRQGDPLSLYLFIMMMEVLSRLLDRSAVEGTLKPHDKCENPLIIHLSFADDIMIFSHGERSSLREIRSIMKTFSEISGLHINLEKSELYLAGMTEGEKRTISSNLGIGLGCLPVRYLGVPLSPTRLSKSDFQPLLQRIRAKLSGWTTKFLSKAGKIQLVTTVIFGMVNSWGMTFVLPKFLITEIDSMCSRFIWQNSSDKTPSHRIAWHTICKPRREGGLGVRRLDEQNNVFRLKLVWLLLSKAGSLWVAWVKAYVFKGGTYWECGMKANATWNMRKLLGLKDQVRQFSKMNIGNGESSSFWFDSWLEVGPLIHFIGTTGPRLLRLPKSARVRDATRNGQWYLPGARNDKIQELQIILSASNPLRPDKGPDTPTWRVKEGEYQPTFTARRTWEQVRNRAPEATWHKKTQGDRATSHLGSGRLHSVVTPTVAYEYKNWEGDQEASHTTYCVRALERTE
ncbi:PREDICTED: uncharacterized protein LOC104801863 [Tarenaya hassleriana]|uniref:uncharacterized protein LOC104801863 n=1 Tax=Tarenaya hassleriana TaxID=28532 RepID=UPI00053C5373|nr:PREDICTED: uncharacterized protein LOC104801863 [Tarenaya hassleriana]